MKIKKFNENENREPTEKFSDLQNEGFDDILADVRNKLSPLKTLLSLVKNLNLSDKIEDEDIKEMFDKNLDQCGKSIEYLSNRDESDI